MDIEDKELFESTLEDQVTEEVAVEEPAPEAAPQQTERTRDDKGRFSAKEQSETVAEAETPKEEASVPSWRLREMREEREAEARRFAQERDQWQRQFAELQAQLPKPEPARAPDVFENPDGFLQHGVQQAIDPIAKQIRSVTEFYSKKDALREHGEEKLVAAYQAMDQAAKAGDPEAMAAVARVKQSMDPYGDLVAWHSKQTVFQQIGNDPNAWFEKQLEARMKDPAFQASILGKTQQAVRGGAQVQNITRLPPSLNKVAASAGNDDDHDMSDAGLFNHAIR